MQTLVVGLNHKTAPVSLLERLTISDEELSKALHQLDTYEHVLEGAILSTCNRTEVYAVVSRFHRGAQDLRNFLAEFCHVAPEELADHLYTYHEEAAVRHLFRVAAGIDSMVVGESEILGQVRRAFSVALEEGVARSTLAAAYRRALRVGRRARNETAIGRSPASVSTAAVEMARRVFPDEGLTGKRVVVVGAGRMGALGAAALARSGAGEVVVVNRTETRAAALARSLGARHVPFARLPQAIASADIVLCSTTSAEVIVTRDVVETALSERPGRVLLLVDISVPRDVDPEVGSLPGVVLRDIDDLQEVVQATMGSRSAEVSAVEDLIAQELDRFAAWEQAVEAAPTISALVERGEEVRATELRRAQAALGDLSPQQRAALDQVTRRIVAKLLHEPIEAARALTASKDGHAYLSVLRDIFHLGD